MMLVDLLMSNVDRACLVVDDHPDLVGGAAAVFDRGRAYRYLLVRQWGSGPVALVVMLNPSTATATEDDQTIRRCLYFARRAGCGALVVVNLFALRSTDPRLLLTHPDPVGDLNDQVLAAAAALHADMPVGLALAAWGASAPLSGRDQAVMQVLTGAGLDVLCLGATGDGFPRHPSRLGNDTELRLWRPAPAPWRALSVRRPWANLLFRGKNIENRSWPTRYRGRLLVHAGQGWNARGQDLAAQVGITVQEDEPGGYLGVAELVDVHLDLGCCRPWGEPGGYHWRLRTPMLFSTPIAGPGQQRLFRKVPLAVTELMGAPAGRPRAPAGRRRGQRRQPALRRTPRRPDRHPRLRDLPGKRCRQWDAVPDVPRTTAVAQRLVEQLHRTRAAASGPTARPVTNRSAAGRVT